MKLDGDGLSIYPPDSVPVHFKATLKELLNIVAKSLIQNAKVLMTPGMGTSASGIAEGAIMNHFGVNMNFK